ncbi:HN1_G0053630.mRNA.1.CDS.1 [Saccharomyces cerevisiae]|nr:HN1_G0053630.mRNA.1.CDS.1 [Saccharomyces cerevisiae]CAI4383768.1 BAL_1a_G0026540.mRNA.1.CDS.1 [Saccharomyces cerevisiae]CAI7093144.1 BAL_1a_G0026540.mRNA.1.CDS.1 [Saccharomyces cerevisiae]
MTNIYIFQFSLFYLAMPPRYTGSNRQRQKSGIITTYVKEEDQFKKGKGRGLRIGTLQATKRLIDSSYEALFLSIYCLSSSKQSFVTKKKAACYR